MTAPFHSLSGFRDLMRHLPAPDAASLQAARARDAVLTKPPGALGRLENLAIWMAGWQGTARPQVAQPLVLIFAGNHGVTAQGVSAFPAAVTAQMVANFNAGGAAINQLAATFGARLEVIALALDRPTADFTESPAMTEAEVVAALAAGWQAVAAGTDLLVTGEMGIGNTTVAAALAAALFGGGGADWVGRGTGVDAAGLALKARVVDAGLARHPAASADPLEALRCLGGRELAAMAGAIARARADRIPVILDGFICCAAAAVLECEVSGALDHTIAGHESAESAHGRLLRALGKAPLLSLGLRLGEGSGAALAIGIVQGALACHCGMATFAEAGVAAG
jgi:nicotinate-nucleotide--dimethylbenzimidazole phosphoribosyltransferase